MEQPYASPKNNSEIKFVKHLFQTKFGLHEDKVLDDSKKKIRDLLNGDEYSRESVESLHLFRVQKTLIQPKMPILQIKLLILGD